MWGTNREKTRERKKKKKKKDESRRGKKDSNVGMSVLKGEPKNNQNGPEKDVMYQCTM
jgi:hypothetical protein